MSNSSLFVDEISESDNDDSNNTQFVDEISESDNDDSNTTKSLGQPKVSTNFNPSTPVVATMTLISKIDTNIDLLNFSKYLTLSTESIISVKFNKDNNLIERSIEPDPILLKKKKKKKPKKYFYNQCTIIIMCQNSKKVNLKLFLNGKIQMTGCKSFQNAKDALDILKCELKKEKYILSNSQIIKKDIIDNTEFTIDDPTIALINCVFHTGININRDILHQIIISKYHLHATYQPIIYVGINSKFITSSGNKVSILIFQTGKIILTAAKTMDDIQESYEFMTGILKKHQSEIEN